MSVACARETPAVGERIAFSNLAIKFLNVMLLPLYLTTNSLFSQLERTKNKKLAKAIIEPSTPVDEACILGQ